MKTYKKIAVSILLGVFTLGTVYTQSKPNLAFSLTSGFNKSGLPFNPGIRVGLGNHFAFNGLFGMSPWRREQLSNRVIAQNVTLQEVNVKGRLAYNLGLRVYTKPKQSGFYAGVGFFRQQISIQSYTLLDEPTTPTSGSYASSANTVAGAILGGLFDLLLSRTNSNEPVVLTENTTINGLKIEAGYAFLLRNKNRIEVGLGFFNRNLKNVTYTVPTFDSPKTRYLDTAINPYDISAEVSYTIPLF